MTDLTIDDVKIAHDRIKDHIITTPIITNKSLNDEIGANIFFKLENLQKTGSFKIFPIWPNNKKLSKRVIVFARKGGNGPTELMPGLVLYNQQGKMTKKAKLISEDGIFKFYKQFI